MRITPVFIIAVLSVFYAAVLILRLVKPNRIVGWRMPDGKENDVELWHRLNRYFGTHFLVSNLVVVGWILFHTYTGILPLVPGGTGTVLAWILYVAGFITASARTLTLQKSILSERTDESDIPDNGSGGEEGQSE